MTFRGGSTALLMGAIPWSGRFANRSRLLPCLSWNPPVPILDDGSMASIMSETDERRLTTILAADVVGYSRLMGEDETGTLGA